MTTLMQVNRQWSSRPADQRFVSLLDLQQKVRTERENSIQSVISTRDLRVIPHPMDPIKGITVEGKNGLYDPTHFSFGQIASLAKAPAGYLRSLPAPIVADAVNYGLRFGRDAEEVGILRTKTTVDSLDGELGGDPVEHVELRAATGPRYGRIWNSEIVDSLVDRFGDGLTGKFRVPGEFGHRVPVTKDNTTIYGSDRDIFVFLADEENRIGMSNRRDGQPGSLARGFFVWNSEVGSATMGIAMFLFDYVCQNRIVWGVKEFKEVRLRHTAAAPDRWLEEITPTLRAYAESSAAPIEETIKIAQQKRVDDDLDAFLKNRFSASESVAIKAAHEREEGRPIETIWDATTAVTAHAKTIRNQDDRVAMERRGGAILDLVAEK
jgi:hypothetical protein